MLRHLVVALIAWVGDPGISRVQLCAMLGCGFAALVYFWHLPDVLPLWPAFVIVALATVAGLYWDQRCADRPVVRRDAR